MKKLREFVKKYKIVIIILFIIILGVSVGYVLYKVFYKEENVEKVISLTNEEAEVLINNNYLYSYIIYGDVVTGEGFVESEDGELMYVINDPLLEDIKSLSDIVLLIEETFTESIYGTYYDMFINSEYNQYTEIGDILYIKKNKTSDCELTNKFTNLILSKENDDYWINTDEFGYWVYYEDGLWKTNALIYRCEDETSE